MSSSLHPSHFCLFQLLCSFLPQLCSPHLQPLEPPVVIICRGNVTTYDLDRLRPGQACAWWDVTNTGYSAVWCPRSTGLLLPFLVRKFIPRSISFLPEPRIRNADPRSFNPTIAYVSNITPSACGNLSYSRQFAQVGHANHIPQISCVLVSALHMRAIYLRWTGYAFKRKTLKELGLCIQLGHWNGAERRCTVPSPVQGDDFVIIDSQGIHKVRLDLCGCGQGGLHTVQLLRARLWAATTSAPRMAGISTTAPGEKSTPQLGDSAAGETRLTVVRFLYALFVAMGTNFRLKRKDVSTEEKDPGLNKGWAFFFASHGVAHNAVDNSDREARGTASSGIGTVDCARHNMKHPNAVGDLQLGERYMNMDYMFFKSLAGTELIRMAAYANKEITIDGRGKFFVFLVPKFHLPAHIEACNLKFSFNLTRDVGQTDGDAPERGWCNANPLARSTKGMGPGSRRDTLDNHCNDWNHKTIVALDLEESVGLEPLKEWTVMAELWDEDADTPNLFETQRKDEHLAQV
ncbi:hypothetical protein B0H14DRAFT_3134284 [Mycena olivaceomarginata]|nr:hypothetical protein B0H14DRAFT_3134284 [Mycena olivaceomarginata]